MGGGQNKPRYQMYCTIFASLVHIPIAYWLSVKMKYNGVCVATLIHFCLKWVFNKMFFMLDPELMRSYVQMKDPETFKWSGIKDMIIMAKTNLFSKVIGFWVFDIFT
jgi:hypothetical protein